MITIGIFAYNEEANIRSTIQTVLDAINMTRENDFEIIMVNDGSKDRTNKVMETLQSQHPFIHIIQHSVNMGIGTTVADIVREARGERICFVPGDDIFSVYSIRQLLLSARKADIILHYHINSEVRQRKRILLSAFFTLLYRIVFQLDVIYINCLGIYSTALLRKIHIHCRRHAAGAELNVKALLQGYTFYEVGGFMKTGTQKSSALRLNTWLDTFSSFIRLWYDVKVRNRKLYSKKPVRVIDTA